MELLDRISLFSPLDFVAIGFLVLMSLGLSWRIDNPSAKKSSVSQIMANYRQDWMRQMVTRDPRIFDAQIMGSLRQGTAFFASTSVIAIGGTLALIGNTETVANVAEDLSLGDHPIIVWEVKLIFLVIFLTDAFLKFAWANRLFGYCSVLMAAVPNDPSHKDAIPLAEKSADITNTAARSFNKGLRNVYFALAIVAWLLGPIALIISTIVTSFIIWRREFASRSRSILLDSQKN